MGALYRIPCRFVVLTTGRLSHHIWRWGHVALPKSLSYMAMGTLCTAEKPLIHGDGDTLHCQKAPHMRYFLYLLCFLDLKGKSSHTPVPFEVVYDGKRCKVLA